MNRSQISNEFNFQNQLDITQNKKDKTQNYFNKEEYGFDDFMNIGDKTFKSDKQESKLLSNTSEILKKQKDQDSYINTNQNFMDQFTELSIKFKKPNSFVDPIGLYDIHNMVVSPKFPDIPTGTTKSIMEGSKKQFTLRGLQTKQFQNNKQKVVNLKKQQVKSVQQIREEQYLQLQNQINFYNSSIEKVLYESSRLELETQNLMTNFNSQFYEIQLNKHAQAIKQINKKIQQQRNLQAQLTKLTVNLEEEYQLIVNQMKNATFSRPAKVTEEQKIIIDQINSLKAQFEVFQRDQGSLNLSSTLLNNQTSSYGQTNTFRNNKKDSQIANMKIQDIYKQNNKSEDPRYLYNIKMSCLRDEWAIYSNSEIAVQVSYKQNPKIVIKIGNKMAKDLYKFSMDEDERQIIKNDILVGKSFILHEIQMKQDKIQELFIHYKISYNVNEKSKNVSIFVPTGLLNFGQFSPITYKQFLNDAGNEEFEFYSGYKPLDKKMVNDISQSEYYMANLLIDRDNMKCFGLFISMFNECSLLTFRQKGEMLSIGCKQNNWSIIRLIQFLFVL